ncbi:ion transport family protein [Nocardiopsis sp. CNR-923]|uniref:ion transporter n=1 Tax=Nocardiopsis sp. CNR-923 TaxID=1904965 RepID=UPI00096463C0|nr:ion transporter [Nocardiopsis sp. CNR-923]OLT27004.1 ion transport family protein [Nocardiopsis sp. CNR-923]
MVESRWFGNLMLLLILANAVVLGWATYGGFALPYLLLVERVFIGVFVIELALKVYAWRGQYFRRAWNWFDFLVVVVSVIPATGPFSVLRVLRVLRILRIISAVPQMRMIITALFRSAPGMGTVIGLLLVIIYSAAVLGHQLFGENVPEYFGDLGTTLYTLFLVMTTENWPDVADAVAAHHPMGWMFFVLYIVLTTFIILNLVIGVIVTSMEQEVDRSMWAEDQELEEIQHQAVMDRLAELSQQVERLERLVREREGQPVSPPGSEN